MGTLANHDTKMPTARSSKVRATVSSSKVTSASKHHHEDIASSGHSNPKAGMGSNRLPDGSLDTARTL